MNDVDNLYSPSYDLSFVSSAQLTFKCAWATKTTSAADMTDKLRIYVSRDCGASWLSFKTLTGPAFINNGYHSEEFVPSSSTQWALQTASIPGTFVTSDTRFKFEYTSGSFSNDLYIDDINITGTLGVDNKTIDETAVSVFPNPSNGSSTLSYHLNAKADTKVELIDVLGKNAMEVNTLGQTEGDHTLQISKEELHLHNGIYFIRISVDGNSITKKLVITE